MVTLSLFLVEAAGVRVFVRFANYDMPPVGRQPFPSGAGSAVTAAENKKGPPNGDPVFVFGGGGGS